MANKKKTFAVDVHWDVAKVFEIEAETPEEAEAIMQKRINAGEVCVWTDGFETTDDTEVKVSGEVNPDTGETEFYE